MCLIAVRTPHHLFFLYLHAFCRPSRDEHIVGLLSHFCSLLSSIFSRPLGLQHPTLLHISRPLRQQLEDTSPSLSAVPPALKAITPHAHHAPSQSLQSPRSSPPASGGLRGVPLRRPFCRRLACRCRCRAPAIPRRRPAGARLSLPCGQLPGCPPRPAGEMETESWPCSGSPARRRLPRVVPSGKGPRLVSPAPPIS